MNYNMKDESLLLRPGREQQKILDQYRLTESFRDAYGNHMLGHCSKGKVVQDAITAIKKFREADEVDISQWKDVIIDLMYCKYVLGFRHWEYFGYGLGNKSIAERLEFLPERDKITYYKAINTNRENFLKLGKKHLTYHILMPYFKRDMCCLQDNGQRDEFFEFCRRHPRFIIKPTGGWGGKGVGIVNREDYKSPEEFFTALCAKGTPASPIVCEELIVCEDSIKAVHPQSVNSVRIVTYLKINGEPTIALIPFLRAGVGDAVADNVSSGGVMAAIDIETGIVYTDASDKNGHVFPAHPDTGFVFKGFQIPQWEDLKKMVLEIAPQFPGVPLISWDAALSKDRGWQLIESNSCGEINIIQLATKTGIRKQLEADIEWDKRRMK